MSDSSTAHEVSFIKNYNEAKENLRVIVERFKKLSQQRSMKTSMTKSVEINEIKNIAECGFEKAKFLNVLEKFTAKNQLKPRESDAKLLEKAVVHHPNLKMYQQNMLNVLPLVDLMISLSCPYELNHNIYKYIVKQWNFSEIEDENFGYRKFLKNLMDILTIYKNHNEDKSISDLMNDEIFTLEPAKLKKQLENRQNVLKLMDLNVSSLDDETELIEILRKFDRFEADGDFLARVISYVKNLRQLMKFQTYESFGIDELMKMDLDNVIGKIIFQQQYSPEQVENFAFNVNINLPHSMAVAAVGEFSSAKSENDEKVLSLFHMSEIGAASVEPELAMEEVREKFVVNNMDILYYIKKKGSFMVAYLVKEIQGIDYKSLKYDEPNFLARLMKISQADLYNNNPMIAALNYDHTDLKLILQKIRTASDVREKLKILRRINERQWNRNRLQFEELRDSYIEILVTSQTEDYSMLNQIGNIKKFADLLLKIFVDVKSDKDAERLLRWCLNPKNASKLDESQLCAVRNWMKKLEIYRKIALMFKSDESEDITWGKIKKLADEKPAVLANYLLNINSNMPLCLEFLNIHPLTQRSDEITKMWVEALNNRNLNENHQMMFKILETFPVKNVVEFFDFALGFINNLPSLVWVINFLTANMKTVPVVNRIRIRYQKFLISTKIFEHLEKVGDELWGLASRPLLLIEQFLMNSRLEVLRGIIYAVRGLLDSQEVCKICAATSSNMYQVGENLVYDFDTHHDDILITNECIDLLLKLYAAKALDFQIIEVHSVPSSTEVSSLDSSYGIFQMPKEIPGKDRWIPDDATSHCMCCKRQKFSLVTRRHHCRRCGRVVCSSCSQNRVEIVEIYGDLPVRVCLECHQQMISKRTAEGGGEKVKTTEEVIEWKLTGNESSDQVVRDEFNFEYSPNVGLCIAIIDLHTTNQELAKFLLFHCHRLELLLRPIGGKINPEIDIVLVAKMLKCLAFSAKIRGENGDANIIIEYADVVLKVAENGCESIAPQIPLEPINSVTIRGIINDLIKVENWKMALELSVKYDRSGTAGVFSAWGVSAIKCGQYRFAREKIDLALANILGSSTEKNEEFLKMLHGTEKIEGEKFTYKRPNRSPPLLMEVLDSLEATASRLKSTEIIKSKKESSKNVLNVMDSLRKIVEGDYGSPTRKASDKFEWSTNAAVGSSYYEESVFYLLNYGGNVEFITFLMRNNLVLPALRYVLAQQVPIDIFIQHVFVPIVKTGRLEDFVKLIKEMDASFKMWETYLVNACKYLERRRSFHCLYHMQILTGDLVRAALTCIKFYLDGSGNYTELNSKAHHLADAKIHLQMELEKTESKNVEKHEKGKKDELTLKWDLKMINAHINLISLQLEISKYMAQCEADRLPTIDLMSKIFMDKPVSVPTLFGKMQERNQVAILLLVCGHSIESGFGISYR